MTDWINCINCGYRFRTFIGSCPNCHNEHTLQKEDKQKIKSFDNKILARINVKRPNKTIIKSLLVIFCVMISIFIYNSSSYPKPSSNQIMELKEYALNKINEDRAKFGLAAVSLSNDNGAAQSQAEEQLKIQKLSHWTTDGMKPYMRYSYVYGGKDNVVQNVAQEAYGTITLTVFNINNNNNNQQTSGDIFDILRLDGCKMGISICLYSINPHKAIDNLEHTMVYDDVKCCNNGHRYNILDKYHTNVGIGIAYDKYYFSIVQNFEDRYTKWFKPISYDNKTHYVSVSGNIKGNNTFDKILITFDPLPSHEAYAENSDRENYSEGKLIAKVVDPGLLLYNNNGIIKPVETNHWMIGNMDNHNNINDSSKLLHNNNNKTNDSYTKINNKDHIKINKNRFYVSFPMDELINQYGRGVYTVDTIYRDSHNNPFQSTSVSLFIK